MQSVNIVKWQGTKTELDENGRRRRERVTNSREGCNVRRGLCTRVTFSPVRELHC